MRALCWKGVNNLRLETVADPEIVNPQLRAIEWHGLPASDAARK
jgi:hypothetical protein